MTRAASRSRWSFRRRGERSRRASIRRPAVRNSQRARLRLFLARLMSGVAACGAPPVLAQAEPPATPWGGPSVPPIEAPAPATEMTGRLNMTGRTLLITAPLLQGDVNLGDVDISVAPDDTISLPTDRLLD